MGVDRIVAPVLNKSHGIDPHANRLREQGDQFGRNLEIGNRDVAHRKAILQLELPRQPLGQLHRAFGALLMKRPDVERVVEKAGNCQR